MDNIKENFLQRHLIWQYIFFALGILIFVKCGKEFWELEFNEENTAFLIVFAVGVSFGALLMASPIVIRNWARKRLNK